jgi:hypothetical protein
MRGSSCRKWVKGFWGDRPINRASWLLCRMGYQWPGVLCWDAGWLEGWIYWLMEGGEAARSNAGRMAVPMGITFWPRNQRGHSLGWLGRSPQLGD